MPPSNSKPCHNCRRRRLRCDRSWPTCHKCAVSGQDCLGYGKVFVWTQGIDSQGNVNPPPGRRAADEGGPAGQPQLSQMGQTSQMGQLDQPPSDSIPTSTSAGMDDGMDMSGEHHYHQQTPQQTHQQTHPHQQQLPWQRPGALTDPLFQDLDRNSRYYLAHFADRVCKDLVVRDTPESNPFRELLPLTRNHPLLLQILIATSAIHWSNIFRPNYTIPAGLTDPGGHLSLLRSKDLVTRQALIDALTAKQKAMSHLRGVLDTLDPAGSEVALAAMQLFIKFDLIDLDKSDGQSWKAHLEAATSIMALLSPDSSTSSSSRMLRDRVISDCFIYHILGSTLASGGLAARIARHAFEFLPVMKRVELTSFLSCPTEILQIILSASQLSHETPWADSFLPAADEALSLIDQALTMDIPAWAAHLQRHGNVTDLESRVHLASAHRSAACLYILQALPLVRAVRPVDTDVLVGDILTNLAFIGEDDPYFKATSWPTFIAGAETRDPEKRTWSLTRLLAIWEICPWGYLFTAIEMLKATWALQDSGRGHQEGAGVNWLRDLRGLGFEHLIV
ncbi:fungal-specific transcription factor domain-containing protein [Ilyonectria destructans]|nr:fungal-specific transcription factor domain-containing protein [Ilyonectria destructans]